MLKCKQAFHKWKKKKELLSQKQTTRTTFKRFSDIEDLGVLFHLLSVESINRTAYDIINNMMDAYGFGIGVVLPDNTTLNIPGYIENGEVLPSTNPRFTR